MACADPAALVAQQQKSRKGRCLRSLAVWAGFTLAAAWCLQGTVLADTDWSRIGGASGLLASIGRYLQLDPALIPELVIPTIEAFMVACVGKVLGCFLSLPRSEERPGGTAGGLRCIARGVP